MSFVENNLIFVKTGMTIHKISKFQPTDTTVKVHMVIPINVITDGTECMENVAVIGEEFKIPIMTVI